MSFPSLRKRVAAQATITQTVGDVRPLPAKVPASATTQTQTGGISRIMRGLFGLPSQLSAGASGQVAPIVVRGLFEYHEGDQFQAGSPSFVYTTPFEDPVVTVWGQAFLRKPNTFMPYQPPQVQSDAHVTLAGLGGLQAGQFVTQGLEQSELDQ
jgi:hypothetical protein